MQRARLKQSGVSLVVTFTIAGNGGVSGARLAGSTGDPATDAALARQVSSLPRMPPHPSGQAKPVTLPITIRR